MGDKKRVQFSVGGIPKAIAIGTIVGVITTLILSSLGAYAMDAEIIGEGSYSYISVVTLFISSVAGALMSIGISKKKRLPICLLVGVAYFLSLVSITALFYNGAYKGIGETMLVIAAGVISVGLLGLRAGNKAKNKIRR